MLPYASKLGTGDGIRTRESLIESQVEYANTPTPAQLKTASTRPTDPALACVGPPPAGRVELGTDEGTRTLGHLAENQSRLAYNLNIGTLNWWMLGDSNPP